MVENIVGKGEYAGHQHFFLFPIMFSKGFFLRVIKSWDSCGKELKATKIKFPIQKLKAN